MDKVKKREVADKKIADIIESSFYVPYDLVAGMNEQEDGVQGGEPCRIDAMKDYLSWMRGFVYAWYGWANDGKSTFVDFLCVLKAKLDDWKVCVFKPEDMDTVLIDSKAKIKGNRIYKNLAWNLTGKTWNKKFALDNKVEQMTAKEEYAAIKFIREHFFIIYPEDRLYKSMIDNCSYMYEKHGIDMFVWDPFNEVELPPGERSDQQLVTVFRAIKKFAMETNSVFNIVSHPRSISEVKEKTGMFKVVNQYMQLGGGMWDIKMDLQCSIHRPYRHDNPRDPRMHFYNLKTKQAEIVGCDKGVFEDIEFDRIKKQYYFNGVNPMTGERKRMPGVKENPGFDFNKPSTPTDDLPF